MKKRTITVEVLEQPFLIGTEFAAGNYPHDGIFQLTDGRLIVRHGMLAMQIAMPAGFNPFSAGMFSEIEPQVAQVSQGIDNLTFLKALAIAQVPNLALELCK